MFNDFYRECVQEDDEDEKDEDTKKMESSFLDGKLKDKELAPWVHAYFTEMTPEHDVNPPNLVIVAECKEFTD